LLDYECEFVNFDRSVVEEGFSFGNWVCLLVFVYSFSLRCWRKWRGGKAGVVRSANFCNFSMVPDIPLPISAARLANSDRRGRPFPVASPFAAAFWESLRSDCRCAPTLDEACRFCTCVRTDRNSFVRSCIDATAIADFCVVG
jgi:hypothetical protein